MIRPFLAALILIPVTASADQVFTDDVIIDLPLQPGGLCVGLDCADGEVFGAETVRIKGEQPRMLFDDTSNSASFPTNDCQLGIGSDASANGNFFVRDVTNSIDVLVLGADGNAALGAGSELVDGAISVGATGVERRVTYVADGVDDSDAVTMGQFDTFKTTALATVSTEVADLDAELAATNERISALNGRLSALIDLLENQ
ncbi:MAG: hypothetical protein ACPG43_11085 [Alcanivoracaceae bacterium]